MSTLLDRALAQDPGRAADVAQWDARQRAAAAHTRPEAWRTRGPHRSQDGRAVWLVVRPLPGVPGAMDIDCECITARGAMRRAIELNRRDGIGSGGVAR